MRVLDLGIIIVYLVAMAAIGIACRGKQESDSDYFTGEGGFSNLLGTVLVGLSIAATFFSGISFLVYPSEVYSQGIAIGLGVGFLPIAAIFVGWWFLPKYMASGSRQPYEIVERRFGYPTRAVAAAMFVTLRVAWMGALIYAPTVAVMAAMGLDGRWFWPLVLTIGLTSTLYTTLGGIRGVIVTDAIQFLVIAVGIAWPIGYVLTHLPIPFVAAWSQLGSTGHLHGLDFSPDPSKRFTFWSMLFGFTAANVGMYVGDQMSLQRYIASDDLRSARRAFAINIVGIIVVVAMLTLLGLAMAVWYASMPDAVPPYKADHVFPYFVATELPSGAPGLILAAILAATMSSMTSGINSLAGTLTLDFVARSRWLSTPKQRLRFGRAASLVIGLLATAIAGVVEHLGSIFEITQTLTGVFLGPLMASVIFSLTRLPVGSKGVIAGMFAGTIAGWAVAFSTLLFGIALSPLWVAPTATFFSFAVPLASAVVSRMFVPPAMLPVEDEVKRS